MMRRAAFVPSRGLPRTIAGGIAFLVVLWVGAMSPHFVHHLFDIGQVQDCLIAAQATHVPSLVVPSPRLVLPQTMRQALPACPVFFPQVDRPTTNHPRAPPSVYS
jgi:hypothetical protein